MTTLHIKETGYVRARTQFETKSVYTCPELGRNPGLDPKRFEAFSIPSRTGSVENPIRSYPIRCPETQILVEWK